MLPVFTDYVDTVFIILGRRSCILRANANMPMALFGEKKN